MTTGAGVHVVRPDDDVPAVLTRLYADAVRDRGTVHVVQLTGPEACDLGIEIVVAASISGEVVVHRDATPGAPPPEPDALTGRAVPAGTTPRAEVVSLRRPSVDGPAVAVLHRATTAVLVIDTSTRRGVIAAAAAILDGLGVARAGVVTWRGRIPRDPFLALACRDVLAEPSRNGARWTS